MNIEDFKWCVDNDFQVYVVPLYNNGPCRIAVRRNGITTCGRDYIFINDIRIESKETFSEKSFRHADEATEYLNYVYQFLRKKYGT